MRIYQKLFFFSWLKVLDYYIAISFIRGFVLILFILSALFSFFELITQLDDVGSGNYHLKDAFIFVGLTFPKRVLDLMPISALLGSIVALGFLADNSELLAMQASGMGVQRICRSVLVTGTLLILITGILAEFVVPSMEQRARSKRSQALSDDSITLTKGGFWARRGLEYIHVGKTLYGGTAADIDIFEFDKQGRLRSFIHARKAKIRDNNQWVLTKITQKTITEQGTTTRSPPRLVLNSFLSSKQVNILELPPESLSSSELNQYIQALRKSGQSADRYALALWRKLSVPLTTGAMILLSLPFLFGSNRDITAGRRIVTGSLVGIVLYLADQVIGHLGLFLSLNPVVTAMTPVALIVGLAFWQLRRVA